MTQQGLKIGALLDHGKYRVEKILGQGGFGITYLVTDLGLDKPRAIKEFFPKDYCDRDESTSQVSLGTSNTADFVERLKAKFIKEARNIACLDQHQGIIRIHTVFEENNTAYYVMDYIDGESLSAMVKRSGSIPAERALKYIKEVGEALAYVHSHNINHLDIKPANIMVRKRDDKAILIDFGLAKQYDSEGYQTSTTPTGISHGFAPFEQYRDGGVKEFSPQTDVYSLAATLYYLISGETPPHATDLIENEIIFSPAFPFSLQAPIRYAMATKRQNRPETVKIFLDSLTPKDEKTVIANPFEGSTPDKKEDKVVDRKEIPVADKKEIPVTDKKDAGKKNHTKEADKKKVDKKKEESSKRDAKISDNPKEPKGGSSFGSFVRKHNKALIGIGAGIISLLVVGFIFFLNPGKNSTDAASESSPTETSIEPTERVSPMKIEDMEYNTTLGPCLYTGEVDDNNKPNGYGVATWKSGDAKSYEGQWVNGKMSGQAKFTLTNGDTFVGTFKDDFYERGRYTFKDDGTYFEGTFIDDNPYQGTWYDKNGQKLEVVDGV